MIWAQGVFEHGQWWEHFAVSAGVTFAALFPIVDPIGNVPFFMSITNGWSSEERRAEAIKGGFAFFIAISVFMVAGRFILEFFGVTLGALEAAGGLVVGYTGWKMVNGHDPVSDTKVTDPGLAAAASSTATRKSVYMTPLAIPQLAGPGAMGMALSLASRHDSVYDYTGFVAGAAVVGLITVALFILGERPISKLGPNGMDALTRILGLFILAVAVELIFHGITQHVVEKFPGLPARLGVQ